jgi:hypothetical protein
MNKCVPACQQRRGQDPRVRDRRSYASNFALLTAISRASKNLRRRLDLAAARALWPLFIPEALNAQL